MLAIRDVSLLRACHALILKKPLALVSKFRLRMITAQREKMKQQANGKSNLLSQKYNEQPRTPNPTTRLANPLLAPRLMHSDQSRMMRGGEPFMPHANDPVINTGPLLPDQSNEMRYFFTGRLCASQPFHDVGKHFSSDQGKSSMLLSFVLKELFS